jgi:hypothetical protein
MNRVMCPESQLYTHFVLDQGSNSLALHVCIY